jgi:hypothetical protein
VVWFIIVVILAAAFGPISRLMPTPMEKRLTALRLRARVSGLVVEIRRLAYANPKAEHRVSAGGKLRDASRDCAAYSLILESSPHDIPAWLLLRYEGVPEIAEYSPVEGWKLGKYLSLSDDYWREVQKIVVALPRDSLALEVEAGKVTCYWRETGTIDEVDADIDKLLDALQKLKQLVLHKPGTG